MAITKFRHSPHVSNITGVELNTAALDIISDSAISASDSIIEICLSSLLFGVLTTLSLTAIFFLVRQGSLRQTNTRVLILSTILLYISTGVYVAALMWNRSQANNLVLEATNGLFSASFSGSQEIAAFEDAAWKQSWMTVIALMLNCIIGDAIVWWRACVIWRNKVVYCLGPPLVSLTVVFGIVGYREPRIIPTTRVTLLVTNNAFVKAAAAMSFATNALATALIAYKMWEHRQLVKKHFSASGVKSRVLNTLAFLVECGSIYCALIIFVMVHEDDPEMPRAGAGMTFTRLVECFIYGCLMPLVAIYPIIIIVMVALNRSPIDTGILFQVHQASSPSSGTVDNSDVKGRESTVVFRLSEIRTFPVRDVEDGVDGACAGEPCDSTKEHVESLV